MESGAKQSEDVISAQPRKARKEIAKLVDDPSIRPRVRNHEEKVIGGIVAPL